MAQCHLAISQDFGRGYGTDQFEPARLRGNLAKDGCEGSLEWGDESQALELPLSELPRTNSYFPPPTLFNISQDRKLLAASCSNVVVLFTLPDLVRTIALQHESAVSHIFFSPNASRLLTCCSMTEHGAEDESSLHVWDLKAETESQMQKEQSPIPKANMSSVLDDLINSARKSLLQFPEDWTADEFTHQAEDLLRAALEPALNRIERKHAANGAFRTISGASISGFGSQPWSPTGNRFLFLQELEKQPPGVNGRVSDLIVWDAENWKQEFCLAGHEGPIMWSGFSPNGKWIASSSWDKMVRIWAVGTGELVHIFSDNATNQSWTGRFSPDSSLLAVGNGDGYLRVWDTESGQLKYKVSVEAPDTNGKVKGGWIRGIAWGPRSKTLFAGNSGGSAVLFDLETGMQLQRFDQQARSMSTRPREVQFVHMSLDGNRLGFKLAAAEIVVYDIAKNERWSVVQAIDPAKRKPAYSFMSFEDNEGHIVFAGDVDGKLRMWNLS